MICDWPLLRDVQAGQQFMGLGDHLKHYVHGYAELVAPSRKLTEKSVLFVFEGAAVQAFEVQPYSCTCACVT